MEKINLTFIGKAIYFLLLTVLAGIAALVLASYYNVPGGIKLFSVQSGSMSPAFAVGSVVVIREAKDYGKGDVVTFGSIEDTNSKNPGKTTTHRIVAINESSTGTTYVTKGDANNSPDSIPVKKEQILGKMILVLPLLGYLIAFARTTTGLMILIVVPSTVIIYNQILSIKKEIIALVEKKKLGGGSFIKIRLSHMVFLLSFVAGFCIVRTYTTSAYFVKSITSTDHTFSVKIPPLATLSLNSDKTKITFVVTNISDYKKLNYQLVYDTDSLPQGVFGTINLLGENEVTRDITLGTCSSGGVCVIVPNPHNFRLTVNLEDASGNITTVEATL